MRRPLSTRTTSARDPLLVLSLVVALVTGCELAEGGARFEPGEDLPGGDTTNTLLLGSNAFALPAENITDEHASMFFSGNSFFNQPWVQAPSSTDSRDGLGPLFNARSCAACHFRDGRSSPPLSPDEPFVGVLLRLSIPGTGPHGDVVPEPTYGDQVQPFAILDVPAEATPTVEYTPSSGQFPDGEPYELLSPVYALTELAHGPMDDQVMISPRVAPAVFGLGLLEAIDEAHLQQLEDPDDDDGDGVSGRINRVWDVQRQTTSVGRFGWKAEQPTVRQQSAGAFIGDIGITSTLFPAQTCTDVQAECASAIDGGTPEIADHLLDRVEVYASLLAVPVRERAEDPTVLQGKAVFHELGCADCHVPSHHTGSDAALVEVRDQEIWPYTDLLLHDMGDALADGRPSFGADGREWRTPPLWGLRLYPVVNGHDRLLHDGRARGVTEAILWHGGEAESAKQRFMARSAAERRALVEFVESL
ncbi:di-heme oxidoreductase family protein [Paraliomyxa miuraensis]|uniref:di-heme oxidoreductase family protein n=1 Tax=Paraliomyxa miuraensis TaxID=376150 RepID=UPI002257617C|nr:di-heme oxidoredictase family protein [Paraliomyxa miuraensis]MCX4247556.1 thiol oxidoreductase [Paraliomyxa miuraensis]